MVITQVDKIEGGKRWNVLWQFSAFAMLLFGIKLFLINSYGNATPFWDQWDAEAAYLYKPYLEGTLRWVDLFGLHNEHRIFTTRLLALSLLIVNGIWNPLLQMVVNAGLHILAIGFGVALITRVIGKAYLPAVLAFSLVLFGVPYAWENTLTGFQTSFYFVLLFSMACLWLTVTHLPLSLRWWGGVVCAVFAFLSLASGIFALGASALVGLVLYLFGLRKTRKQLLSIAVLGGLFVLGAALTPSLAGHASTLKATSFLQFFDALKGVLGWPMSAKLFSVLLRNLPALIFVVYLLWKRPPANDRRWYLFALVVWTLGQAVGIAYGRAVGNLSSRYLDLFAIGILVNFACLISIAQDHIGKRYGWAITSMSVWIITVLISLVLHAFTYVPSDLAGKRGIGIAEETNTKNYLATGDLNHLKDKPLFHVPYPDPERLASILASSSIQGILPSNIRRPLTPILIENKPTDVFVEDGFYPTTPKRSDVSWGSYGAQGNAATGRVSILFDNNKQSVWLAIPVAGYPIASGMKLEIEQNGQRKPVLMKSNPQESWGIATVAVDKGPFAIHLTDSSSTVWMAAGVPSVTGKLDELTRYILANYLAFIILGLVAGVLLLVQSGLTTKRAKLVQY